GTLFRQRHRRAAALVEPDAVHAVARELQHRLLPEVERRLVERVFEIAGDQEQFWLAFDARIEIRSGWCLVSKTEAAWRRFSGDLERDSHAWRLEAERR